MYVLIPSKSDGQLQACLESMERYEEGSTACVIVGDNGLSPALKKRWPSTLFASIGRPFVYAQAINVLAMLCDDDILILGDDTKMMTPGWRTRCQRLFDDWPRNFGALSAQLEGRGSDMVQDQILNDPGARELTIKQSRYTICFNAVLIPRPVWTALDGLDERFTGYGHEDDDFCVRCWHLGYSVGVTNVMRVWHGRGSYAQDYPGQAWEDLYDLNAALFSQKWGITYDGRKGL